MQRIGTGGVAQRAGVVGVSLASNHPVCFASTPP